jgi:hypothetical protein
MTEPTCAPAKSCCEVPLTERLRSVPELARVLVEDPSCHGTRSIPVGSYCHAAASVIEQLKAEKLRAKLYFDKPDKCLEEIKSGGEFSALCPFPIKGAVVSRDRVYRAINTERDYQDSLGPERVENDERPHTVTDELTMIATYLRKAQDAYTNNPNVNGVAIDALHVIRKIAGMCVRCMENHGAPYRMGSPVSSCAMQADRAGACEHRTDRPS